MDWTRWLFIGALAWFLLLCAIFGAYAWYFDRQKERREYEKVASVERMGRR